MNAEYLHDLVWTRFVRMPYGHIIDYTDEDGNVYVPTPEECQRAIPNPLGWWTPIENGAFFTGLYLYALIEKYNRHRDEKTAAEIKILVKGLFLLQDVSRTQGFIARGVSHDGHSHYPFSSDDQFTPWVLALYSFYKCKLCENKDEVRSRLLRALCAVRDLGWSIPCEIEGLTHIGWGNSPMWRCVCKMLFCARIIYELTNDKSDLEHYLSLAEGCPDGSVFTRLEIASHGYSHDLVAFLGTKQNWICACSHFGLKELARLDKDNFQYYKDGITSDGITALGVINDIKKYDNQRGGFDINWRRINHLWEDFNNDKSKGLDIARRENVYWQSEVVPHRKMEHEILGNALFCALIAITCENEKISSEAKKRLLTSCEQVDFDGLRLSYAFVAESGMIFGEG